MSTTSPELAWLQHAVSAANESEGVPDEREFYGRYPWALNVFNETRLAREKLRTEIDALRQVPPDWRQTEVLMNVYLLAAALSDSTDDWLQGSAYDLSKAEARIPFFRAASKTVRRILEAGASLNREKKSMRSWRARWESALGEYLISMQRSLCGGSCGQSCGQNYDSAASADALKGLLDGPVPQSLLDQRCRVPAAFRSQDLTYWDVVKLAEKLAGALTNQSEPLLIVGCRTAGSYFAPVVRATLRLAGFAQVTAMTVRPKRGLTRSDRAVLEQIRRQGGKIVLVDEPVNSGSTMRKLLGLLRGFGFTSRDVHMLVPVHPSRREWRGGNDGFAFSKIQVVTLEPEEWFKARNGEPDRVKELFSGYFANTGAVVESVAADPELEAWLNERSEQKFHSRFKRVYRVILRWPSGATESRRIIAKSAGWGWLAYAAYHAAERMSHFVPTLIGMRDGMIYTEWVEAAGSKSRPALGEEIPGIAAAYIAARVRRLGLGNDPVPSLAKAGQHKGLEELSGLLSRAYGWKPIGFLSRPRILDQLSRTACPVPTLIDGKMRPAEWVSVGGSSPGASRVKTDFEHHGQGKTELNVSDPAYDLADTILQWNLDAGQERELLARYRELSGDETVEQRLFLYKLLAGSWTMERAIDNLKDERLRHLHADANRAYIAGFDFLTDSTTRRCGEVVTKPRDPASGPAWGPRWAVLDIDGVIDKQIFGFPSNTAAGCRALSGLHNHGFTLALNTARSLAQVKVYAEAYGCAGGVAEYGSAVWDRVSGRERVLVAGESLEQMERLKHVLRSIPGVYLNENYRYSIRAYLYERGVTVPLPGSVIRNIVSELRADRLRVHQTYTDTTIIAREVDKGSGMRELVTLSGARDVHITAIGDSEPDLPMFSAADAAWAPGHISCRSAAALLGCRVAGSGYQAGLAEIVNRMVHADGAKCRKCLDAQNGLPPHTDLFARMMRTADLGLRQRLQQVLFSRHALNAFRV